MTMIDFDTIRCDGCGAVIDSLFSTWIVSGEHDFCNNDCFKAWRDKDTDAAVQAEFDSIVKEFAGRKGSDFNLQDVIMELHRRRHEE